MTTNTGNRLVEEQIELVRLSWKIVSRVKHKIGILTLQKLFHRSPRMRNMFPEDTAYAAQKLMVTLEAVVHNLNELSSVEHIIRSLAEEYYEYGLKPGDFKRWESAILWSIHKATGDEWSDMLQQGWEEILGQISRTMIRHIRSYEKF